MGSQYRQGNVFVRCRQTSFLKKENLYFRLYPGAGVQDVKFQKKGKSSYPVPLALDSSIHGCPLWTMSRPTAYRLVKWVMARAGIVGKQATGKGLRNGFGVAMSRPRNRCQSTYYLNSWAIPTLKPRKYIFK